VIGGDFLAPNQPGRQSRAGRAGMTATSWYIDFLYNGENLEPQPTRQQINADLATWRPAAVVAVTSTTSPLGSFLIQVFGQPNTHIGSVLAWRLAPGAVAATSGSG
jgi:hypothetical protein